MDRNNTLSVFGLGKLGSSMLASFASKGWNVIGVDVNQSFVDKVNQGISPIEEPQVPEFMQKYRERISATTDFLFAVKNSYASFIVVPTPSMENGLFSTEYVQKAIEAIATALHEKSSYHLIIITSTVLPGDTEKMAQIAEQFSGKKLNEGFGLCYNPDFIALGKVVQDFLNPDMILIGQSDPGAGGLVEAIHRRLVDNKPDVYRMSWHNAELAKISLNSYLTMKITFANIVAEICENMPTGDAKIVLDAIGSDTRVGHKYFRPGLAFCGPCLPRDCRAFCQSAKVFGVDRCIGKTIDEINNYHKTERICNLLMQFLDEKGSKHLAILGLSYKEDTPVIEESVSIAVMKYLVNMGIKVTVYDPVAMGNAQKEFIGVKDVFFADSMYSCLNEKSVCFIATPWPLFKTFTAEQIKAHMGQDPIILDAWSILSLPINCGIRVRKIGKNLNVVV
jgi:UDPglucose 6-dehydrogenase